MQNNANKKTSKVLDWGLLGRMCWERVRPFWYAEEGENTDKEKALNVNRPALEFGPKQADREKGLFDYYAKTFCLRYPIRNLLK